MSFVVLLFICRQCLCECDASGVTQNGICRAPSPQPPQLSEDEIAEMMSANAEVIVGQTLG